MDITLDLVNSYCDYALDAERRFTDALRRDTEATFAQLNHLIYGQDLLIARGTVTDRSPDDVMSRLGRDFVTTLCANYLWCTGGQIYHHRTETELRDFLARHAFDERPSTGTPPTLFMIDAATWAEDTRRRYRNGTLTSLRLPEALSLYQAPAHLSSVMAAHEYRTVRSSSLRWTSDETDDALIAERESDEQRSEQDLFDWEYPDGRTYPASYDPNIIVDETGTDWRMFTRGQAEERRLIRYVERRRKETDR